MSRCAVLVALALVGVAGCSRAEAKPRGTAGDAPTPFRWPAATEGGACLLMDFEAVEQTVGASFDVAGKGQSSESYTCVVQSTGASLPDLTLAVSGTSADAAVFKNTVTPKGAAAVPELGKHAYAMAVPAAGTAGPGVEVGWLSADNRLLVLRYRSAPGAPADPAALTPRMIALAKRVDKTDA